MPPVQNPGAQHLWEQSLHRETPSCSARDGRPLPRAPSQQQRNSAVPGGQGLSARTAQAPCAHTTAVPLRRRRVGGVGVPRAAFAAPLRVSSCRGWTQKQPWLQDLRGRREATLPGPRQSLPQQVPTPHRKAKRRDSTQISPQPVPAPGSIPSSCYQGGEERPRCPGFKGGSQAGSAASKHQHGLSSDSRCSQPARRLLASSLSSPTPPAAQIQLLLEQNAPSARGLL